MKKIIRPEGPAKKIILLRFCPKKISRPGPKFQAPPPPPEYQMDRALVAFYDTLGIRRTYSRLEPPASSRGYIFMDNLDLDDTSYNGCFKGMR